MEEPVSGGYRKSRDAVIMKVTARISGHVSEVSAQEQTRLIYPDLIMEEDQNANGKEYGATSLNFINSMQRKERGKEHLSEMETSGQKRKYFHARNEEVGKVKGSDPTKVEEIKSGAIPKRYVGSWDSKLGKLVYEELNAENPDLQLEKDPHIKMFFPRGEGGPLTKLKMCHECPSKTSPVTRTEGPVNNSKQSSIVLVTPSLTQGPVQKASSGHGRTGNWKKRARGGQQETN